MNREEIIARLRENEATLRQRGVDRIGQGEDRLRSGAGEEFVPRTQDGLAGENILLAAVVALVIDAYVDGRQPEHVGLLV